MTFDPSFLKLMVTAASYLPFSANNMYGEPSFGTAVAFQCHVTYKRVMVRTDTESERVSNAQVQLPPGGYVVNGVAAPTVTIYDKIQLPFDNAGRKVINVQTFTDDTGVHHQTLWLE